jgi:hypothetical protein
MDFHDWLDSPEGRHCETVLAASGVASAASILELAFVAGRIAQAREDRALVRGAGRARPGAGPAA